MTGFEPLLLEAAKSLAGLVLKTAWEMGNKPIDEPIKQLIFKASHQYIENYEKRHGNLKIVCVRMDAPVRLDEVYTAVQLLERGDVRYFESAETLQDLFRQSGRGFEFKGATRQDGIAVANQHQYLMVLGGPGVGKSTFLRKVGLEALKRKQGVFQHECVPVFLKLQDFNSNEIAIVDLIVKEFETCGFPEPQKFTEAALEKGNLLILLDGLDEVPTDNLDHAIAEIGNLVDRHSKNRFIASCRIAAYKGGFQRFKDLAMAAFDDTQIEEFIRHWFRSERDVTTQCWNLLKQSEYAAAKELAQTPLLLTLLCVVYDESQDFPKNRAALYGEALDVLLKKWAAEKRLKRDPIYRELSPELEQILLSEIAYSSFAADQLFFSKREVTNQIKAFLVDNLNAPKHLDGEAVLNAIEVQQGILVERARDAYSFSHLTFQEYLVAKYISEDYRRVEKLVAEHLTDRRWQEVFLLVSGLIGCADELLELVEEKSKQYLNTSKIQALLVWADEITADSQEYKAVIRKCLALDFASALDYAIDMFIVLATLFDGTDERSPITRAFIGIKNLIYALDKTVPGNSRSLISEVQDEIRTEMFNRKRQNGSSPKEIGDISITISEPVFDSILKFISESKYIRFSDQINLTVLFDRISSLRPEMPSDQPDEPHQEFIELIQKVWIDAFQLPSEWVDLSEEEAEALANYLYANELMVRCKEAAVRVSREKWEAIEARMLTVPAEASEA